MKRWGTKFVAGLAATAATAIPLAIVTAQPAAADTPVACVWEAVQTGDFHIGPVYFQRQDGQGVCIYIN